MFSLDLARAHIDDLHRATVRSHRSAHASSLEPSRLHRLVARHRSAR